MHHTQRETCSTAKGPSLFNVALLPGAAVSFLSCVVCFVCVSFHPTQVLEKTFYMENPDEIVPEKFVGCTIDWAAGKDTTGDPLRTGQGGQGRQGGALTQGVYLGRRRGRRALLTVRLCTHDPQHNSRPTQLPARQHPHLC